MTVLSETQYDIVIVGGGLVGNSLALALRDEPLRIAVIDAVDYTQSNDVISDNRAIGLSHTSQRILQKLHVWSAIESQAHPIQGIHISLQNRFGVAKITAEQQGLPTLGCNVDIQYLQKKLADTVKLHHTIELLTPYRLTHCTRLQDQWQLTIDNGAETLELQTRLLVAADGSDSWIRRTLGITAQVWDYQQTALVARLSFSKPLNGMAYERFTQQGLLAILPTGENTATFIWSAPHDIARQWQQADETQLLQQLHSLWGYRLGKLLTISKPICYPLKRFEANEIYRQGVVLLGNAAQTLHPVAEKGFNLGLHSAMMLVDTIKDVRLLQRDYAETAILADYAAKQAADRKQISRFTHFLVNRFSLEQDNLTHWQPLALFGLEWIPGAKALLARLGLGGAQKALWV